VALKVVWVGVEVELFYSMSAVKVELVSGGEPEFEAVDDWQRTEERRSTRRRKESGLVI
jgi:hypothetical protein